MPYTSVIDISSTGANLSGNYTIIDMLNTVGTTIIGNSGNNYIEGGSGSDIITGGAGADDMSGGGNNGGSAGHDIFKFSQGDSTAVIFNDNVTAGLINTGDTFFFTGGADIVEMGNMSTGDSAAVQFNFNITKILDTTALGADQYKLIQGWFDWNSNVFNVDSTYGSSTLVVYDGSSATGATSHGIVLSDVSISQLTYSTNSINYVL